MRSLQQPAGLYVIRPEEPSDASPLKMLLEEVVFWNDEATVFQYLLRWTGHGSSDPEQADLVRLRSELDYWLRKVIPGYQCVLKETARNAAGEAEIASLKKQQEKLRHRYQYIKRQLLPFVQNSVNLEIW